MMLRARIFIADLSRILAGRFQQTSPSQQLLDGLVYLFEVRFSYGMASDEY